MDSNSFLDLLTRQTPALELWGAYVSEKLLDSLKKAGLPETFVKIPPKPRVKTAASAAGKLLRKSYSNPSTQMTDLVGVRFVVLLSNDIDIISTAIESEPSWTAVVARDFLEERNANVKVFDYQSKHYELRPSSDTKEKLGLEYDFCCEVQLRTLLQHAYAEMVHDNIYKPSGLVPAIAERHVARSMALIETTDEIFCRTMNLLSTGNEIREVVKKDLDSIYKKIVGEPQRSPDASVSNLILDTYSEFVHENTSIEIEALLSAKAFISIKINQRLTQSLLFTNSIILFVYLIVYKSSSDAVRDRWPLAGDWRSLDIVEADLNA